MTTRSTLTRSLLIFAASLLVVGLVLKFGGPTKGSSGSSAPPAVRDGEALAVARAVETPAATVDAGRTAGPDAQPLVACTQAAPAYPEPARPAMAGMVIGIDPETGKLGMPTREQLKNLSDLEQQRLDHSPADLVEVHHPDGSVSVDLQGRFQEFATVRIGPDGKRIFQCVDGRENAERALRNPALGPAEDAPAPRPASEER